MTRNYADMLWSAYNFWCTTDYDKKGCDSTHWVSLSSKVGCLPPVFPALSIFLKYDAQVNMTFDQ